MDHDSDDATALSVLTVIPDWIRDPCSWTTCIVLAVVVCLQAGGCPAASNFLLRRQKKVTKEKATR
ncbi:MAG: hypothetical protein Q7T39_05250, partial [Polaromonas sp.]|nr:hypothetical protein [Polaromonas sp.]